MLCAPSGQRMKIYTSQMGREEFHLVAIHKQIRIHFIHVITKLAVWNFIIHVIILSVFPPL